MTASVSGGAPFVAHRLQDGADAASARAEGIAPRRARTGSKPAGLRVVRPGDERAPLRGGDARSPRPTSSCPTSSCPTSSGRCVDQRAIGRILGAAIIIAAAPRHFAAEGAAEAADLGVPLANIAVPISIVGVLSILVGVAEGVKAEEPDGKRGGR